MQQRCMRAMSFPPQPLTGERFDVRMATVYGECRGGLRERVPLVHVSAIDAHNSRRVRLSLLFLRLSANRSRRWRMLVEAADAVPMEGLPPSPMRFRGGEAGGGTVDGRKDDRNTKFRKRPDGWAL